MGETFEAYLNRQPTTDFSLRLEPNAEGKLRFYIYPAAVDGDTPTYEVSGNSLTLVRSNPLVTNDA